MATWFWTLCKISKGGKTKYLFGLVNGKMSYTKLGSHATAFKTEKDALEFREQHKELESFITREEFCY